MVLDTCLRSTGALLLLLALMHAGFFKRFNWSEELPRLSLLNRQIFVVHTFFIALVVGFMGVLSLVFPDALMEESQLAKIVLVGLVLFWAVRLAFQWFVYDRKLWRGQRFNTIVHFSFTALWTYMIGVYAWTLWQQFV